MPDSQWVESLALVVDGPFAMPALSLLVFCGAICPVPMLFSSSVVACGYALGFWLGFVAAYPAAVLGACTAFAAGRRLQARFRDYIPRKVVALCDAVAEGGFATLLLLRLTPLTVAASSAFLGGMPGVSASQHAAACAVGFCRLAMHVHIGVSLQTAVSSNETNNVQKWLSVAGALFATGAVGNVARILLRQQQAKTK
jgi:uncharacterized membrane protein YdjX (TVP38/TMEM64 family)